MPHHQGSSEGGLVDEALSALTPAERAPVIALVAGEASGDALAAHLMSAIRARIPQASFVGIGGPRMVAEQFDDWWPSEKLAVRGYVEVLRHYTEISGIRRALAKRLLAERPALFIGVDAPDFNLGLEARLKAARIPTAHFVSPSIWAWRGGRIRTIAESTDHMLCLFPFEPALYEASGVRAHFVGHPFADTIPLASDRAAARSALGLSPAAPVFALMPGSRQSELKALGARFVAAAKLMHQQHPNAQFVVPLASPETSAQWQAAVQEVGAAHLPITLAPGRSHEALAACDSVLVASGTATLEAALFKRPMVIAYAMPRLSYALMRRMGYLPWIGLPNILARRFVVPELVQDDATPENLAQAMLNLHADPTHRANIEHEFATMHGSLRQGMAARAAEVVAGILRQAQA